MRAARKSHGQRLYNRAAIPPRGECKSDWEVMGLLARKLGFHESWLHQTPDEVIDEVLMATAAHNSALRGITLERLKAESTVALNLKSTVPFAEGRFPMPSGKVELYSQKLAAAGLDPLPGFVEERRDNGGVPGNRGDTDCENGSFQLVTAASHHFVSSSLASQAGLLKNAGAPWVEIHPDDARTRGIQDGDMVIVENGRGHCRLRAVVTDRVRTGVLASPKGRWSKLSGGRNVNWTTPDALADLAGQSTFHSNQVWVRRAHSENEEA